METPHVYAGGTLDRAAHLRRDESWLAEAWRAEGARMVVLWRGACLIEAGRAALRPAATAVAEMPARAWPWAWLGLRQGHPVFALDLSAEDAPQDQVRTGRFEDLRAVTPFLPAEDAALLAYARALLDWRRRSRFCGRCGGVTRPAQGGHMVVCASCAAPAFPRTDPTVIMLVLHRAADGAERALLAHNARFPDRRIYSVLAGFVEPGESLEEAVARETFEETGVEVGRTRYHSSQPWPYPTNLMLGFVAEARTTTLRPDPHELIDARWVTRAEAAAPSAFELPPPLSIARRLIDEWVAGATL